MATSTVSASVFSKFLPIASRRAKLEKKSRTDKEELSCPICYELFVDPHTPKNLPSCGHVCCELCLKKMVKGQKNCPECRQKIKIPEDGIPSYTTNYRLRTLAENHQKSDLKTSGVPLCHDHEDEKVHYYCVTCNSLACQACLTLKHNGTGHKIEDVKEIYRKQKDEMNSVISMAKSRIDEVESILCELKTAEIESTEIYQNISEVCENVEKQIEECIHDQINELLANSQELKLQVKEVKQKHLADLTRSKKKPSTVQKYIESANVALQVAASATENLPDYEYIIQHALLIKKIEDAEISKQTTLARKRKQDAIKFVRSSTGTKLGHIISVTPGKVRTIKKIQTLDEFIYADRLDCTSDGLLAITDFDAKKIAIYHKINGKYEKKLDQELIPDNQYKPNGLALCPDGRFMVARHTCIEVYSLEGEHQNDIEITESGEVNLQCVKVTSDGRILVGAYHRNLLMEINPMTGNVIRTIETSIEPRHMILLHDTHIAISDCEAGKVIVIDLESGLETLSIDINAVTGICYDEHTECLLTARSKLSVSKPGNIRLNSGVIEQYCYTTGKLLACLQEGLYFPHGLATTSDGHLIVADKRTVEIYEIC